MKRRYTFLYILNIHKSNPLHFVWPADIFASIMWTDRVVI